MKWSGTKNGIKWEISNKVRRFFVVAKVSGEPTPMSFKTVAEARKYVNDTTTKKTRFRMGGLF